MTGTVTGPRPGFLDGPLANAAVPFGGRKQSGFGREPGEEALEPCPQSKSIWLDLEAAVPQSGQGISI